MCPALESSLALRSERESLEDLNLEGANGQNPAALELSAGAHPRKECAGSLVGSGPKVNYL